MAPEPPPRWRQAISLLAIASILAMAVAWIWRPKAAPTPPGFDQASAAQASVRESARALDEEFASAWAAAGLEPAPPADSLTVARRLSLALVGSIPSLEETRALEAQDDALRLAWWTERLLQDPRSSDYLAERLARAYVGTEGGPFLLYRRRILVTWLSQQLQARRPYDEIARELIAAEGIWTTNPAANFLTVTIDSASGQEHPDQVKLANRTSRAFLGTRLDCVECHDDKLGGSWKQEDFHQLAAYFAGAERKLTGIRDDGDKPHEARYRGQSEERVVLPAVPFHPELAPASGRPRERLAAWSTHPENRAFARAMANRMWGLLLGRPLVEPVDDIPLDPAKLPPGLDSLAADFAASGFDLSRLIRVIASTRVFQLDSRSGDPAEPLSAEHERLWAAYPLTRLRPEQVAGSVFQATYLGSLDHRAPFLIRLARFGQETDFVKRHGDSNEDHPADETATIPQRLLLMNGKMVRERLKRNPVLSAVTRIESLAPDAAAAVEAAYLCVLTRRPQPEERDHFVQRLEAAGKKARHGALEDLFWALLNATEFSWNH